MTIQIGNLWLLCGAIIPALVGSTATFPDTSYNKYSHSALLGLSVLVFSTIEMHQAYLKRTLVLMAHYELPAMQLLFLHFGAVIFVCWLFQVTTNHCKSTLGQVLTHAISNVASILITVHALLLPNYFV